MGSEFRHFPGAGWNTLTLEREGDGDISNIYRSEKKHCYGTEMENFVKQFPPNVGSP